jgi:protease I
MKFLKFQKNPKSFLIITLSIFYFANLALSANSKMEQKKMKTVGFIIANEAFRDEEYLEPKKILDKADFKTITISKELKICNGKLGAKVKPDMILANVDTNNFDAIVFIGGPGCKIYWHDEKAHQICKDIISQNKIFGAICSSVATPAFAGILKGKKANSFETERIILKQNGAIVMDDDVVVDGNIITATGPKAAKKFGKEILKKLR